MEKKRKGLRVGLMMGLMILAASPVLARSISLQEAETALWVFLIIGVIIILMQLIPAAILFFSFIGSSATMVFKKGTKTEEAVILPARETMTVKE